MKELSILIIAYSPKKVCLSLASLRALGFSYPIIVASFDKLDLPDKPKIQLVRPTFIPPACPNALLSACLDFNKELILRSEGLKAIQTRYTLILEEGTCLKSWDFLQFLQEKSTHPSSAWLSEKVLIPCARYRLQSKSPFLVPFYFDYWVQAGLTSDLLKLWDLPLLNLRDLAIFQEAQTYPYALPPACAYLLQALKLAGLAQDFQSYAHYSQTTNSLMKTSEALLLSSFRLLPPSLWQIKSPCKQGHLHKRTKLFNKNGFYSLEELSRLAQEAGLLRQAKVAIYRPFQASSRLAFAPYFDPLLCFIQESSRYVYSLIAPKDFAIGVEKLSPQISGFAQEHSIFLGEQESSFPAGKKPFKRLILLTIEGREVQKARKAHYYGCTAFTTRALKALFLSHLNTLSSNSYLKDLQQYPSLGKRLKEEGFYNIFVRTASCDFDQFGSLFSAMGMHKVLEMKSLEFIKEADYQAIGLSQPNPWAYPSRLLFKEAIGHLKKAKENDQAIFMLILNTDTHNPPVGMAMVDPSHYGNLAYPSAWQEQGVRLPKDLKNTLEASYRFAYDLDLFFEDLQKEGLWDEETLFIISADHSQNSPDQDYIPNNKEQKLFDELPLFILSARALPPIDQEAYATHLDLAPTILDLLGLAKPAGYWGRSLYGAKSSQGKAWFSYLPHVLSSRQACQESTWLLEDTHWQKLWRNFYIR
ncbi:UNVERIFIED_CONTAM: hypothetical protein PYX00_011932 [Menopon gallinae]|uniref:Sulfatase N-terminal domain-containing protein n=1 Tax=Menopon gallinae TaxID=328185 RepID=A0AAW2H8Q9_9NEOP